MNWIETTIPGEGITRYDLIDDAGPEFPLATVHDNGGGGSWLWNATGGPVGWGLTESEAKRFAEEAVLSVQAEWEARHPRPKHPRGPRGRNAYGHNEKPEGGGNEADPVDAAHAAIGQQSQRGDGQTYAPLREVYGVPVVRGGGVFRGPGSRHRRPDPIGRDDLLPPIA